MMTLLLIVVYFVPVGLFLREWRLRVRGERALREAWIADNEFFKKQIASLQDQLAAAPSKECQTWIDRWAQSVKDHKTSHDAAERFLAERNKLQLALDRIEHAARAVVPDEDLMKALEGEKPRILDWRCTSCRALWSEGSELSWRWNEAFPGFYEHLHGQVWFQAEAFDVETTEAVKEFRGGCMGHA